MTDSQQRPNNTKRIRDFLRSFIYAIHGLWSGIADQRNLKFQLAVGVIVVGAGFYLSIAAIEWCIILLCIAMVIGLELVNTALENLFFTEQG